MAFPKIRMNRDACDSYSLLFHAPLQQLFLDLIGGDEVAVYFSADPGSVGVIISNDGAERHIQQFKALDPRYDRAGNGMGTHNHIRMQLTDNLNCTRIKYPM
ncbi:hypothetical protein D1872_251490 [compost metagenome]